jgi:dihydrofolate reductase
MRRLRYSINVTLDGCCDHRAVTPDAEAHRFWGDAIGKADALLYGRVTYQMMEAGWREVARTGVARSGMPEWMVPFAHSIDQARKYVVSDSLAEVDWNSTIIRGKDLQAAVMALKAEPGGLISTGGVTLPLALAELGLIDEYQLVVHPHVAGHGPTLLAGLPRPLELRLLDRQELGSGAVVLLYERR